MRHKLVPIAEWDALQEELKRYRTALEFIRDSAGQVCGAYEICEHRSCASSYAAWAAADEALRNSPEFETAGDVGGGESDRSAE